MIIVTGGAGFIGSNLVRGLNRRGREDVLIVDDLKQGGKERALAALTYTDVIDYREFAARLESFGNAGVEAVFHQGACTDTMEHDAAFMLRVN